MADNSDTHHHYLLSSAELVELQLTLLSHLELDEFGLYGYGLAEDGRDMEFPGAAGVSLSPSSPASSLSTPSRYNGGSTMTLPDQIADFLVPYGTDVAYQGAEMFTTLNSSVEGEPAFESGELASTLCREQEQWNIFHEFRMTDSDSLLAHHGHGHGPDAHLASLHPLSSLDMPVVQATINPAVLVREPEHTSAICNSIKRKRSANEESKGPDGGRKRPRCKRSTQPEARPALAPAPRRHPDDATRTATGAASHPRGVAGLPDRHATGQARDGVRGVKANPESPGGKNEGKILPSSEDGDSKEHGDGILCGYPYPYDHTYTCPALFSRPGDALRHRLCHLEAERRAMISGLPLANAPLHKAGLALTCTTCPHCRQTFGRRGWESYRDHIKLRPDEKTGVPWRYCAAGTNSFPLPAGDPEVKTVADEDVLDVQFPPLSKWLRLDPAHQDPLGRQPMLVTATFTLIRQEGQRKATRIASKIDIVRSRWDGDLVATSAHGGAVQQLKAVAPRRKRA